MAVISKKKKVPAKEAACGAAGAGSSTGGEGAAGGGGGAEGSRTSSVMSDALQSLSTLSSSHDDEASNGSMVVVEQKEEKKEREQSVERPDLRVGVAQLKMQASSSSLCRKSAEQRQREHAALFRTCMPPLFDVSEESRCARARRPRSDRLNGFDNVYRNFCDMFPAVVEGERYISAPDYDFDDGRKRPQRKFDPTKRKHERRTNPNRLKHIEKVHGQAATLHAYRRIHEPAGLRVEQDLRYMESISEELAIGSETKWSDLRGLDTRLARGVEKTEGSDRPFPAQRNAFRLISTGRGYHDLYLEAPTGTGKTMAFLLPLLNYCLKKREAGGGKVSDPLAVIISPSQPLAVQTYDRLDRLVKAAGVEIGVMMAVGGCDYMRKQNDRTIIIATPGRLKEEVVTRQRFSLDDVDFVVIDEADKIDQGNYKRDIEEVYDKMMPGTQDSLMTIAVSATLTADVFNSPFGGWQPMTQQRFVYVRVEAIETDDIKTYHVVKTTTAVDRLYCLVRMLEDDLVKQGIALNMDDNGRYNLERKRPYSHAFLVFVNRRSRAAFLTKYLQLRGFDAQLVSGDLTQKDRQENLDAVDSTDINTQVLVCTNVVSRGIDQQYLDHVIIYELDHQDDDRTDEQRMGRVGRAGAEGDVTIFVSDQPTSRVESIKIARISHMLFNLRQMQPRWMWNWRNNQIENDAAAHARCEVQEEQAMEYNVDLEDPEGWATTEEASGGEGEGEGGGEEDSFQPSGRVSVTSNRDW